jgi:hypothetical protein
VYTINQEMRKMFSRPGMIAAGYDASVEKAIALSLILVSTILSRWATY